MKFIRIYIEVGNDGTPIYADEFAANAKKTENMLIASKEYVDLLENIEKDNVLEIPSDIMQLYDKNLQNKSGRYIMMKIYNNDSLKNWLKEKVSLIDGEIQGIYMRGEYSSIIMAARELNILVYIKNEVKPLYESTDQERNYQLIVDTLERKIQYLESLVEQNSATIESLKASIVSNNNYIHNLQIHATNLDNDLKKYKEFYDVNHEVLESAEHRIKYAEDEVERYVGMYKKILDELDGLKIEKLELQEKMGKRR